MLCSAKPWREELFPDSSSDAADEGTAAHFLMEQCLIENAPAKCHMGKSIMVGKGETQFHAQGQYPMGLEMAGHVQKALDYVAKIANGAPVYPERELSIAHINREYRHAATGVVVFHARDGSFVDIHTGEVYLEDEVEPSTGTSDVTVIAGTVAHILDLKYGRGVQVFAKDNEQLAMYGDAALLDLDLLDEVEEVHLHIMQPRLDHFDVWVLTRAELTAYIGEIRRKCIAILGSKPEDLEAVPGEKQCKFCKAKATCGEHRDAVLGPVLGDFVDLDKGSIAVSIDQAEKLLAQAFGVTAKAVDFVDDEKKFAVKKPNIRPALDAAEAALATADDERLATLLDAVDMLESFAKAVRAETERRLLLGTFTDTRYKLVQGKRGNRDWISADEAEAAMKAQRLKVDQMYNFKLISPPQAETLLKASNPRKWAKLEKLIHQTEGKPSVAPASDPRPALQIAVADAFEVLEDETSATTETPIASDFDDLI